MASPASTSSSVEHKSVLATSASPATSATKSAGVEEEPVWVKTIEGHSAAVNSALFCFDDTRILTCSEDKSIVLWGVESTERLQSYEQHDGEVSALSISHATRRFCSVGWDRTALLWDAEKKSVLWEAQHRSLLTSCSLSSSAHLAAIGCDIEKSAVLWDVNSNTRIADLCGHKSSVMSCHVQPENNLLCTASLDKTAVVWDLRMRRVLLRLRHHINGVSMVQLSPSGRIVCTGSWDRLVCLWDITTGSYRKKGPVEFLMHDTCVGCCRFSPDGCFVISGGFDGLLVMWDCRERKCHYRFKVDEFDEIQTWILGCDISNNYHRIVTALQDGSIKLWNIRDFDEPIFLPDIRKKFGLIIKVCPECKRTFSVPHMSSPAKPKTSTPSYAFPNLCVLCRMQKPSRCYSVS